MFAIVIADKFAARQEERTRPAVSNERFSLAVLGSNEGLFDWNLATGEVYFSGQFRRLIGGSIESNQRGLKEWLKRVQLSDRKILFAAVKYAILQHQDVVDLEYRIAHANGSRSWIHTKVVGTRDKATGKLARVVGSISDVTQRKMGEVALKASETRFRSITEAHPVPVLIARLEDGQVLYASPGAEALLDFSASLLLAQKLDRLIHPAERQDILGAMMRGEDVNMKEITWPRGTATRWRRLRPRGASIIKRSGHGFGAYDLPERKAAESKIAQQQEALQQSEKWRRWAGFWRAWRMN